MGLFKKLFGNKKEEVKEVPEPVIQEPEVTEPVVQGPAEPVKPAKPVKTIQDYEFKVKGISFRQDDIVKHLMVKNDEYSWKKKDMIEFGDVDELVRKYAANLGWDWHLLEAVVWQESQFRIEARSPRGALGLMQMMPSTARKYGVDDMLDPEENLRAGVEYLAKLQRMFDGRVAPEDLPRFTLAAYNAGEGRILDCIRMAQTLGMPHQTWQDIVEVIPHMREEAGVGADTVLQLGYFKGYETLAYIRLTDSLSRAFRCIVP